MLGAGRSKFGVLFAFTAALIVFVECAAAESRFLFGRNAKIALNGRTVRDNRWDIWSKHVSLNSNSLRKRNFYFNPISGTRLRAIRNRGKSKATVSANSLSSSYITTVYEGKLIVRGMRNLAGAYVLSVTDGPDGQGVQGHFLSPDQQEFELSGSLSNLTLKKVDDKKKPGCANDDHDMIPPGFPARSTISSSPDDAPIHAAAATTIRTLVVYTQSARAAAGGTSAILSTINSMVAYANTAYSNSGVDLAVELAGTAELGSPDETGKTFSDILGNITDTDSVWDNIQTLRTSYGADVVSVIIQNGDYCGLGWLMTSNSAGFAPYAYNAVNYTCISSFAHEAGHNEGLTHDVGNAGGAGAYNYAYGWRFTGNSAQQWRTIMAYAPGTRIQYFSNPSVNYDGQPTGTGTANNALALTNTKGTVANFASDPGSTPTPTPTTAATNTPPPGSTATPVPTATPVEGGGGGGGGGVAPTTPTPTPTYAGAAPRLTVLFTCSAAKKKVSIRGAVTEVETGNPVSGLEVKINKDGLQVGHYNTNAIGGFSTSRSNVSTKRRSKWKVFLAVMPELSVSKTCNSYRRSTRR